MIPFIKKNKKAKSKANRKSNITLMFLNIIEITLVLIIVFLFYTNKPLYSSQVLLIPKGNTSAIVSYLNKKGYELNLIDKITINFIGYPQSGWIDLKSKYMTKFDFLYKLTTSKAALKKFTLIPGETYYFFLKDLANKFNLSSDKLREYYIRNAYKNDGNVLAETYFLPYGMKENQILHYLMTYTNKKYESFSRKVFGDFNKEEWYKYIKIASIIQKESASIEEMPIVSSVIHNRLSLKMPLQMDGTLNYGIYSHTKVTAEKIKTDETSYNTYKKVGLPKHPICAVSIDAIKAAIFPKTTDYLYFVKDEKTGLHRFSKSYKKHISNINDYRREKKEKKSNIKNLWN